MPEIDELRDELEGFLRLMVDEPERLNVEPVPMRRATIFEVTAAGDDLGKLIGRRGRTAQALRTLLDCRGDLDGAQYGFEIVDD